MGQRPSPKDGQSGELVKGRGVSYCKYELVRTYIAAVAEVEVKGWTGEIRNTRFYVVHDCGQIIDPDGLEPNRRQRDPDGELNAQGGA